MKLPAEQNSMLADYSSLIKFSHTIFALPFALIMAAVLSDYLTVRNFAAIIACLVSARTAAMSFNRVADARIDGANPRTKNREIPAGIVSRSSALMLCGLSCILFIISSGLISFSCLALSPVVLIVLLGYSLTKRFTAYSHYVLGLSLALAPGGVWYALTDRFAVQPLYLMGAVLFWVAGFDIIYSIQDLKFDKENKLFSVPSRFGREKALTLSRLSHLAALICLLFFGKVMNLGGWYFAGVFLFSLVMAGQHFKVSKVEPENIEPVFFTYNGVAAVALFLFVLIDRL